jgi:hypothetical protein
MKLQLSQFFLHHLKIKDVYNGNLPPERKSNIMSVLFYQAEQLQNGELICLISIGGFYEF